MSPRRLSRPPVTIDSGGFAVSWAPKGYGLTLGVRADGSVYVAPWAHFTRHHDEETGEPLITLAVNSANYLTVRPSSTLGHADARLSIFHALNEVCLMRDV